MSKSRKLAVIILVRKVCRLDTENIDTVWISLTVLKKFGYKGAVSM